jgi:ssRNA-specific RNase YbeY (16S rRNA maturation enzyme)
LGYDHEDDRQAAREMESLTERLLADTAGGGEGE